MKQNDKPFLRYALPFLYRCDIYHCYRNRNVCRHNRPCGESLHFLVDIREGALILLLDVWDIFLGKNSQMKQYSI